MSKEITKTKLYYNANAQNWDFRHANSFYHELQFQKFVSLIPKGASIIDIGCASGVHVPLFLGIGRSLKYTGLDISTSFKKIARKRYPQLPFLVGDISKKQTLPKKKFDGFFAAAILMHIPFKLWNTMFENIEKISKAKAIGYIVLPTEHPNKEQPVEDPRHFTILDEKEQKTFIQKRGWKILYTGISNGSKKTGIWKWYIVQLP